MDRFLLKNVLIYRKLCKFKYILINKKKKKRRILSCMRYNETASYTPWSASCRLTLWIQEVKNIIIGQGRPSNTYSQIQLFIHFYDNIPKIADYFHVKVCFPWKPLEGAQNIYTLLMRTLIWKEAQKKYRHMVQWFDAVNFYVMLVLRTNFQRKIQTIGPFWRSISIGIFVFRIRFWTRTRQYTKLYENIWQVATYRLNTCLHEQILDEWTDRQVYIIKDGSSSSLSSYCIHP